MLPPIGDDQIIELSQRWIARYQALGRYAHQTPEENLRDEAYWTIVYGRAREQGQDHGSALQTMENGMAAEAGQPLPFPPSPVQPLRADGAVFVEADGTPWTAIETSEFALYMRYLRGEDVRPILADRLEVGFNLLRVWLLNQSMLGAIEPSGLTPAVFPPFYDQLRPFADQVAAAGLRVEFTAFTQTPLLMPRREDQQRHLDRIGAALTGSPHLLELVNEYDHTTNGLKDNACAPDLTPPTGILFSSGSMTADQWPILPVRDYSDFHPGGDPSGVALWARKVGHNSMEVADAYHVPVIANETIRYPDSEQSVIHAEDAAAGAALLCAGACFHSAEGKLSQPFAASRAAAEAWVRGARSVPLAFQRGVYHHRTDLETPTLIRVYDRTLPDGRSHVVAIRA